MRIKQFSWKNHLKTTHPNACDILKSSAFSNFEVSIILKFLRFTTLLSLNTLRSLQIYQQILYRCCSFMTRIKVKAFTKDGRFPHLPILPPYQTTPSPVELTAINGQICNFFPNTYRVSAKNNLSDIFKSRLLNHLLRRHYLT